MSPHLWLDLSSAVSLGFELRAVHHPVLLLAETYTYKIDLPAIFLTPTNSMRCCRMKDFLNGGPVDAVDALHQVSKLNTTPSQVLNILSFRDFLQLPASYFNGVQEYH